MMDHFQSVKNRSLQDVDNTSDISFASTSFSSSSRCSVPLTTSRYHSMRSSARDRDSHSDVGIGSPRSSSRSMQQSRSVLQPYKASRAPDRSLVSASSAPSSQGSGHSLPGPALPLPRESTLHESLPTAPIGEEKEKEKDEGFIMARTTRISLLLRKWQKNCFWTRCKSALLIFNNRGDYKAYKKRTKADESKAEHLLKAKFEFCIKKHDVPVKYWMGDIKPKCYNASEGYLHQFKIERSTQGGTNIVAAFASTEPSELNKLRKVIARCMRRGKRKDKVQRIKLPTSTIRRSEAPTGVIAHHKLPTKLKGRFVSTSYTYNIMHDDDKSSLVSSCVSSITGSPMASRHVPKDNKVATLSIV